MTTQEISSPEELRELLGPPMPRALTKERTALHARDREWLALSPFCLVATADADGNCDVSPKGDPPGFTLVLDETTIAIPERPGNRRADGYRNILANPHVGLVYLIPGRTDTLRINGRARLLRDAPWFDDMTVKGHRPVLAVEVTIEQIFYHCAKAFLRSELWQPETWQPDLLPSRARLIKEVEAPAETLESLEHRYGPEYLKTLYS
ncbi:MULTISPECIES: pyridoxamine 5'-phosphate oxidase family protein [Micromonospora]|uniref:Pyridoxamine 5'-phosphate oxidase family protein n=1 Tax=Micromonospora solifontis TaxID=2487138 RepID=A0ABX9WNR9_9ACTN|nr:MULTISPECIES: pyridoxamine 5'-phosphate oxidase family protein [Micromonospora]NES13222.1 pyridoxamine 5'-phosphate oxidase family protein [Micromonospora sp. PPF5-17B]NES34591.1 pyridoxamine 5'-phosphate oxidase family protein [Micromonospora solifontis]NES57045.1 pyridoxamine 5'-phosphate oxidase family protein [Micromonospora sp. PPF5-6]RNM01843.1 pyridoxamine 5'-phosphate oxidase family protein [Micromonospora solifontis]